MKIKLYDHKKIERKWQKYWKSKKIYKTKVLNLKSKILNHKSYILDMFPYPSGEGLHVGHPKGYIATDIYSRYKKMNRRAVLHPMGWDAFGLPAENYAIKNKIHPEIAVKKNIKRYKEQLQILGLNYDWKREINTTDPKYYKWTQWIFLQMFKKGLAYQAYEPINWCPSCQTGLANEDVEEGLCERCGTVVEKKPMRQWMLKISDYAERLVDDLEKLDWPESIKESQRNWIGKSDGAEISFQLVASRTERGQNADFTQNNAERKRQFVILHGYTGSAHKNFIPWLKKELEKTDSTVEAPELPSPNDPKENEQVEHVIKNCHFDENTVVIGHSLGGVVAIKTLMELNKPVSGLVLVAPAIDPEFPKAKSRPFWKNFSWNYNYDLIKKLTGEKITVLSDTREKIRAPYLKFLSDKLGAILIEKESNIEHFCALEEPEILKAISDKSRRLQSGSRPLSASGLKAIDIFTTRPDTIFGATYLVISPEKLEEKLQENNELKITNYEEVQKYIQGGKKKTEIERTTEGKVKTGVELKGIKAINPANGEEIPVWIADYVLPGYGTGAIMAVPAHDERDFEFAQKFNLPTKQVIAPFFIDKDNLPKKDGELSPRRVVQAIVRHPSEDKIIQIQWKKQPWKTFVIGGAEEGESYEDAVRREVIEETGYKNIKSIRKVGWQMESHFYAAHKNVNRQAFVQVFEVTLNDLERDQLSEEEKEIHNVEWVPISDIEKTFKPVSEKPHILDHFLKEPHAYEGGGILINSSQFDGLNSEEAKEKIIKFVGGQKKITYKLRDWVFSRQRYWGEPIPVIHCQKCGVVPVPERDLPVKLPKVKNYAPTGTGESPLANIKSWVNVKCPKCKGEANRETNTMPQWAGSSWYHLRYIDPKNDKALVDKKKEKIWSPVDLYVGGTEHATRHLIYARFWHKFLFDIGAAHYNEPYTELRNQGLIMASDGRKMSKRYGNVINPDEIVDKWGADTLRVYEMFMGPFEQAISWNTQNMIGSRRFLEKVWKLKLKISNLKFQISNPRLEGLINETIKKVTNDIESFHFNTVISALMILTNSLEKEKTISRKTFEVLLKLLSPFAPHITEELWNLLNNKKSIHLQNWPKYDLKKIKMTAKIAVQINGKTRSVIELPAELEEEKVKNEVLALPEIKKWLENKSIKKVIYVKGKIINLLIS